jgi:nuclear pore complex protein Nup155
MAYQMPPATPQRPGPGAFINTPAPNRPGMQRQTSMSQPQPQPQQPQQQQQLQPVESPIERAARTINNALDRDCRYPSLEGYIGRE